MATNGEDVQFIDQQEFDFEEEDGTVIRIPAFDDRLVEERDFEKFRPLTGDNHLEVDAWLKSMRLYLDDILWLRQLDYRTFWSTIIFDREVHSVIDSFLRQAARRNEQECGRLMFCGRSKEVNALMANIYKNVFLVITRMALPKESRKNQMSPQQFGEYIWTRRLLTPERILDVCAVYADDNAELIEKMIDCLIRHQPKYLDAFTDQCNAITELLERCALQVEMLRLSQNTSNRYSQRTKGERIQLTELCTYMVDVAYTLRQLLSISVPLAQLFYKLRFLNTLLHFYQRVFDSLHSEFTASTALGGFDSYKGSMLARLVYFGDLCSDIFRILLEHNCIQDALKGDKAATSILLDHYDEMCSAQSFACDYDEKFPLSVDLDNLHVDGPPREKLLAKLEAAKHTCCGSMLRKLKQQGKLKDIKIGDRPKLREMVDHIRSTLPNLSDEFVHLCLRHYKYQPQDTLHALLELKKLPRPLRRCRVATDFDSYLVDEQQDQSERQGCTPPVATENAATNGVVSMEYKKKAAAAGDLLATNGVADKCQTEPDPDGLIPIPQGKKHGARTFAKTPTVLNDEEMLSSFYDLSSFYAQRADETEYKPWEWEDEYDDTYDSAMAVAAQEPTADGDRRRAIALMAVATARAKGTADNDESEDSDEQPSTATPAAGGSGVGGENRQRNDYTGGNQRQFKERNKARVAHHNRKDRARAKYGKGMF